MRGLKRVVVVLAVLVIVLVILAFVLENRQVVSVSFLGLVTDQLPVSVFIVVALIVGMLVGPLLGLLVRRPCFRSTTAARV